jgi:hypothetical protein
VDWVLGYGECVCSESVCTLVYVRFFPLQCGECSAAGLQVSWMSRASVVSICALSLRRFPDTSQRDSSMGAIPTSTYLPYVTVRD